MLLDEATSALDVKSEMFIGETLCSLSREHTLIMVNHRFTNVQYADRIIVMENGSIVEEGTHRALLDKRGSYAHLYYSSLRESQING
ncbi:Putative multidrug export ATP-binding/permease protein [Sporomusa rhizae]